MFHRATNKLKEKNWLNPQKKKQVRNILLLTRFFRESPQPETN